MISIFSDLLEECMEVFMEDFTVYAKSFEACLDNLSKVLRQCIDSNLLLHFEKCHLWLLKVSFWDTLSQLEMLYPLFLTPPLCRKFIHFLVMQAIHQGFQQDCPAFVQAAIEGRRLHLRLALCGCISRAEEKAYDCAHPPITKLGTSI
ncbi:hypothetical protein CR513_02100, partial [Mucuna pruriens]